MITASWIIILPFAIPAVEWSHVCLFRKSQSFALTIHELMKYSLSPIKPHQRWKWISSVCEWKSKAVIKFVWHLQEILSLTLLGMIEQLQALVHFQDRLSFTKSLWMLVVVQLTGYNQWRAEVWLCPGWPLDFMPLYQIIILSSGVWWSLLLDIRCLWRHNTMSYSCHIHTFANSRFGEVCWHNMQIILHALSLLLVVQCVTTISINQISTLS